MIVNSNLNIDRFLWAKETVQTINQELTGQKLILFDIGAGEEVMRKEYISKYIEYHGFDIDPQVHTTRYWDIGEPFSYGNQLADIVTLLEVVEHLDNPWTSIKNIASILNSGGYLLITTPNPLWSNARMEMLTKGALTCFAPSDLELNHHVFTPWPHIIERLLLDNGFKIISYHTLDGYTKWFDKTTSLKRLPFQLIFRGLKKLIEKRNPESKGMSYAVIAQKK